MQRAVRVEAIEAARRAVVAHPRAAGPEAALAIALAVVQDRIGRLACHERDEPRLGSPGVEQVEAVTTRQDEATGRPGHGRADGTADVGSATGRSWPGRRRRTSPAGMSTQKSSPVRSSQPGPSASSWRPSKTSSTSCDHPARTAVGQWRWIPAPSARRRNSSRRRASVATACGDVPRSRQWAASRPAASPMFHSVGCIRTQPFATWVHPTVFPAASTFSSPDRDERPQWDLERTRRDVDVGIAPGRRMQIDAVVADADRVVHRVGRRRIRRQVRGHIELAQRVQRADPTRFPNVGRLRKAVGGARDVGAKPETGPALATIGAWGLRLQPVQEPQAQVARRLEVGRDAVRVLAQQRASGVVRLRPVHDRHFVVRACRARTSREPRCGDRSTGCGSRDPGALATEPSPAGSSASTRNG